jgi:hypothetical protein
MNVMSQTDTTIANRVGSNRVRLPSIPVEIGWQHVGRPRSMVGCANVYQGGGSIQLWIRFTFQIWQF